MRGINPLPSTSMIARSALVLVLVLALVPLRGSAASVSAKDSSERAAEQAVVARTSSEPNKASMAAFKAHNFWKQAADADANGDRYRCMARTLLAEILMRDDLDPIHRKTLAGKRQKLNALDCKRIAEGSAASAEPKTSTKSGSDLGSSAGSDLMSISRSGSRSALGPTSRAASTGEATKTGSKKPRTSKPKKNNNSPRAASQSTQKASDNTNASEDAPKQPKKAWSAGMLDELIAEDYSKRALALRSLDTTPKIVLRDMSKETSNPFAGDRSRELKQDYNLISPRQRALRISGGATLGLGFVALAAMTPFAMRDASIAREIRELGAIKDAQNGLFSNAEFERVTTLTAEGQYAFPRALALGVAGGVSTTIGVVLLIASRKRSPGRVSLQPDIGLTSAALTLKGSF